IPFCLHTRPSLSDRQIKLLWRAHTASEISPRLLLAAQRTTSPCTFTALFSKGQRMSAPAPRGMAPSSTPESRSDRVFEPLTAGQGIGYQPSFSVSDTTWPSSSPSLIKQPVPH